MYNRRKLTSAPWPLILLAVLAGVAIGFNQGNISGAILYIKKAYHLSAAGQGITVSELILGAIAGSLFSGQLADRIGRRAVLLYASSIEVLFAIAAGSVTSFQVFFVSRFIIGIAIGMLVVSVPMYISEMSITAQRGRMGGLIQLGVAVGLSGSFWSDYAFSRAHNWHAMILMGALPGAVFLASFLFIRVPDSPRFSFLKGRQQAGVTAITWIHHVAGNDDPDLVGQTAARIREEVASNKGLSGVRLAELLKPGVRMALLLTVGFETFQLLSGISVVTLYTPHIFHSAGFGKSDALLVTASISVVTIAATIAGILTVDRWGRRPLLLMSFLGMGAAMAALGAVFFLGANRGVQPFIAIAAVIEFHIAYSAGVGILAWILIPEIFGNRVRARGQGVGRIVNWSVSFIMVTSFLSLQKVLGVSATFWLIAAMAFSGFAFMYFVAPETRDRTLEAAGVLWRRGTAAERRQHSPGLDPTGTSVEPEAH
ncbi:MAG: sugar porter family MFS transporter [Acidimicrobiales bacterium]